MFPRSSGILLHLTSLPGPYGIGTMGRYARGFIDFLQQSGQRYWQMLPLVVTGKGNSPYMSTSSAAGNPWLIDLELLFDAGLLTQEELSSARWDDPDRIDFDFLQETRIPLLRKAFSRLKEPQLSQVDAFLEQQKRWLPDYALFMACHTHFDLPFYEWPDPGLVHRSKSALTRYRKKFKQEIRFHAFLQYTFFQQWHTLKAYANQNGIQIIGDIPFYVSPDSVDVWVHPELFQVGQDCRAKLVAGVPPDLFTDEGQFWGNPLYHWPEHEKNGYAWWCNRIQQSMSFYDVIRIDHFRGFDSYWEIPAEAESAKEGRWRAGPGMKLMDAIRTQVPEAVFIAEDLGDLTASAYQFIRDSKLPGMRVLVDAFHDLNGNSSFLPHHCVPNSVMYTGTHDTPTFMEWYATKASWEQRQYAKEYLRLSEDVGYSWGMMAGAWSSVSSLAIAPFQDVLGLGGDARMNTPGTVGPHNWSWRVRKEAFNSEVASRLSRLTWLYGRRH